MTALKVYLPTIVSDFLLRRAQRRAEALALRNAEHAHAIELEHNRHYGNVCASLSPSLPSQQLAAEIEELRTGKVMPINRKRALRGRA